MSDKENWQHDTSITARLENELKQRLEKIALLRNESVSKFVRNSISESLEKELVKEIKRLYYDEKLSTIEVAKELGLSTGAIQHRMNKNGLKLRSLKKAGACRHEKGMTLAAKFEADIPDMVELRKKGLTYKEIGKSYGISPVNVNNILKRHKEKGEMSEQLSTRARTIDLLEQKTEKQNENPVKAKVGELITRQSEITANYQRKSDEMKALEEEIRNTTGIKAIKKNILKKKLELLDLEYQEIGNDLAENTNAIDKMKDDSQRYDELIELRRNIGAVSDTLNAMLSRIRREYE